MMCRTSGSQRGVMTPMGDHNVVLGGYTKPGTAILIAASQPQAPSRLLVCMNLGEQLLPQGCTFQPAPHSLQEHSSKAVSGMQLKKKLSCWGGSEAVRQIPRRTLQLALSPIPEQWCQDPPVMLPHGATSQPEFWCPSQG